jgi:hypothetical protein
VGVNVGYRFTDWLRGSVGYTFLYWADPLRAAGQVDRIVNLQQPAARPGIPFATDAFWAQGLSAGLEFRW